MKKKIVRSLTCAEASNKLKRTGNSLVEIMVTISVISTILLILLNTNINLADRENLSNETIEAASFTADTAELIKNLYYSNQIKFNNAQENRCSFVFLTYSGVVDGCRETQDKLQLNRHYIVSNSLDGNLYLREFNDPFYDEATQSFHESTQVYSHKELGLMLNLAVPNEDFEATRFFKIMKVTDLDLDAQTYSFEVKVGLITREQRPRILTHTILNLENEL